MIESRQTIRQKEQRAIPQILEAIEKCKPDLIHIHGTEELWGKITQYVSKIPIVFSIQGLLAPIKEKYFIGLSKKNVRKFDSFVDKLLKNDVNNLYQSFIYRAAIENGYLRYAEYIFGRTQWDRNCTLALNPARKYYLVNELLRDPFYNYNGILIFVIIARYELLVRYQVGHIKALRLLCIRHIFFRHIQR